MDLQYAVEKQRTRKPYFIECKKDTCNWSSSRIYAYSHSEAVELAIIGHDTHADHRLQLRKDRKNYLVTCKCGKQVYFKAGNKKKEAIATAKMIHDQDSDHELEITEFKEL